MLPNLVIAILVVLLFYGLSRLIKKVLDTILHRLTENESVVKLVISIATFSITLIGLMVALGVLNLDKTVTSVLAGIGVVGLALGFAFQDAAANLISGIIMAVQSPINVGDILKSNDVFGKVTKIGLRSTTIYDPAGQNVVLPNRLIFQNIYRHYTINKRRRVSLECGISYHDDLNRVKEVAMKAIHDIPYLLPDEEVQFYYVKFDSSSINFVIRYWIAYASESDFLQAQSDGIILLKKAFDAHHITIPYPIRTLDLSLNTANGYPIINSN